MTLAGAATGRNPSATSTSASAALEIPDIAPERILSGIGDGRDADRLVMPARAAVEASLRPVVRIELGVELGKRSRSRPRANGSAAPGATGRRSNPLSRSSTYCDQLIDLPNSPSLMTSIPVSA